MRLTEYMKIDEAFQSETGAPKRAVFTFGRFNPMTKGHQKLISTVLAQAGSDDHFIFPSRSKDETKKDVTKNKNPLDAETKIGFMKHMFPNANIVNNPDVKNPFQVMGYLSENGYTDLVFVVGSDRIAEFTKRMSKAEEYFDTFQIVNAGTRDPDADDAVAAMSATAARKAAVDGDIAAFRIATGWSGEISRQLMDAVSQGLKKPE